MSFLPWMRRVLDRISLRSAVAKAAAERAQLGPTPSVAEAHLALAHRVRHGLVDVESGARDALERTLLLGGIQESPAHSPAPVDELGALREQLADRVGPLRAASERLSRLRLAQGFVLAVGLLLPLAAGVAGIVLVRAQPPNQLSGAAWRVNTAYPGYELSGTLDDSPSSPMFFCTNREVEASILLELPKAVTAGQLVVENRADCCGERAVPLLAEVSLDGNDFREVARIEHPFKMWRVNFPAAQVRFLRLRATKNTWLHFRYVRLHAP